MMMHFQPYDLSQSYLLPPAISDWVPEGHFARFVSDVVDTLDMSEFYAQYDHSRGKRAYHPDMMLKVILYSFSRGVYSSRKMEQATYDDVGTRFLAANYHPDYSSFCNFHLRHRESIQKVFVQVVMMCRQAGLSSMGHIAIDGTRVKGNASRARNVRVSKLDEEIQTCEKLVAELLEKWQSKDAEGDSEPSLPEELRSSKQRLERLLEVKKTVERITEERHQIRLERFEREMAEREREHQLKVQEAERENVSRRDERAPLLAEARKAAGLSQLQLAKMVEISRGRLCRLENGRHYPSEEERARLAEALGVEALAFLKEGPTPNGLRPRTPPEKREPSLGNLTDPESTCIKRKHGSAIQGYNCQLAVDSDHQIIVGMHVSNLSMDRENLIPTLRSVLEATGEQPKEISADSGYFRGSLETEPMLKDIDLYIPPFRKLQGEYPTSLPFTQKMREKMLTEEGKKRKIIRCKTVEPVFGHMKYCRGFSTFLSRGLKNVATEWALLAIAHNLRKLCKYGGS